MIYRYGEGFRYDTMYPANDPANAEYNDVDGKTQKKNIKVLQNLQGLFDRQHAHFRNSV